MVEYNTNQTKGQMLNSIGVTRSKEKKLDNFLKILAQLKKLQKCQRTYTSESPVISNQHIPKRANRIYLRSNI